MKLIHFHNKGAAVRTKLALEAFFKSQGAFSTSQGAHFEFIQGAEC